MKKRFAYFYFMKPEPDKIQKIIPVHVEYWQKYRSENYVGGPFVDRSGGLITFETASLEEATDIINNDPFTVNDILDSKWLKEWLAEK